LPRRDNRRACWISRALRERGERKTCRDSAGTADHGAAERQVLADGVYNRSRTDHEHASSRRARQHRRLARELDVSGTPVREALAGSSRGAGQPAAAAWLSDHGVVDRKEVEDITVCGCCRAAECGQAAAAMPGRTRDWSRELPLPVGSLGLELTDYKR